jgi:hypothetical protein
MSEVTTAQAAELTGKNRTTIWRACKTGRISAVRGAAGDFLIQVAELERAYGTLRAPQPANGLQEVAEQQPATSFATSILEHEVALLRERVASLERDKDDCESALKWDPGRFPGKLLDQQAVSGRQVGPDRRRSGPT